MKSGKTFFSYKPMGTERPKYYQFQLAYFKFSLLMLTIRAQTLVHKKFKPTNAPLLADIEAKVAKRSTALKDCTFCTYELHHAAPFALG
jgi:hypothetical protein